MPSNLRPARDLNTLPLKIITALTSTCRCSRSMVQAGNCPLRGWSTSH
jgi:hypothetical protein